MIPLVTHLRRRMIGPLRSIFASRSSIVTLVLNGTIVLNAALVLLLFVSVVFVGNYYVLPRLIFAVVLLSYLIGVAFINRNHDTAAAWLIIVYYGAQGLYSAYAWGINAPISILLCTLVIILPSIILTARRVFPIAFILFFGLVIIHSVIPTNVMQIKANPSLGDLIGYGVLLLMFALLCKVARQKADDAIRQAQSAEHALAEEKRQLARRLHERTEELRNSQAEEMKQLYRFAELGQLTSVILHELANYLSVLTLDIEDLEDGQTEHTIARAKESINYLDDIVIKVRRQLEDSEQQVLFNASEVINSTILSSASKAKAHNVTLSYSKPRKQYDVLGDSLRLNQLLMIIINNAIEACKDDRREKQHIVKVTAQASKEKLVIKIEDNGIGIPAATRKQLFRPLVSSKAKGLGIGLYIASQMIETHFKGTIMLEPDLSKTIFTITLPIGAQKHG